MSNNLENSSIIIGLIGTIGGGFTTAGVAIGKVFRRLKTLEDCAERTSGRLDSVEKENAIQNVTSGRILEKIAALETKIDESNHRQEKQNDLMIGLLRGQYNA